MMSIDARKQTLCRQSIGLQYTKNSDYMSYSVTGIGTCTDKNIVIPPTYNGLSVTSIEKAAFRGCANLTSITISDGIKCIGDNAFVNCENLASIAIPHSVTSIGKCAFSNCWRLTDITIPESITSINDNTFDLCANLTSVVIPSGVISIGERSFRNCRKLNSIAIPVCVKSVGASAFHRCENLKNVYYSGTKSDWVSINICSDNIELKKAKKHYCCCLKCGSQIPRRDSLFCPYCGTQVFKEIHKDPSAVFPTKKISRTTKKEKNAKKPLYKYWSFWVIAIILAFPILFLLSFDDISLGLKLFGGCWLELMCVIICYKFKLFSWLVEEKKRAERVQIIKALKTEQENQPHQEVNHKTYPQINIQIERLMTSQFPALYLKHNNELYHDTYKQKLEELGFNEKDVEKMFEFECDVIRKYGKWYLTDEHFTKSWLFSLHEPFFKQYPQTKEDILNEKYLTMSELCKLIDEAEWHFWNSHEKELPDGVWEEIYEWRLGGYGAKYATTYFEMIEKETGISYDNIGKLCALQGTHLNKYKWH